MDYKEEYNRWLSLGIMKDQLLCLNEKEKEECFYKELAFGTGGIRAVMGPGPNRLNIYTIRKITEGYANYVEAKQGADRGVVIAYDNRHQSKRFAREAAAVLSTHGIQVYVFNSLRPTPELSFAVRYLHAFGGIVITASHNTSEYNGYKIYDEHGCQCVPRDTDVIIDYINKVGDILAIQVSSTSENKIKVIGDEVDEAYYKKLLTVQERPELNKTIKVVYTPLHGTGNIHVIRMLQRLGYKLYVVGSQCAADPDFTYATSVNPENKKSFDKAIELAKQRDADIAIATDPDCDRLGIVVKHEGKYHYLTGNQTGAILIQYLLQAKVEKNTLPKNGIIFNTIVTSDLGTRIAKKYGVEVESTLTGFKFIGDKIREYGDKKQFLFGYEESYGYMIKDFTRDKDGIQSSILICEACQYYKDKNLTLIDVLNSIYDEFGYCEDSQESETLPGIEGIQKMKEIVNEFRSGAIDKIEGRRIVAKEDYLNSTRTDSNGVTKLTLPKSNVVKLILEDESWVVVRPSGNEPKIKYYKNLWKKK